MTSTSSPGPTPTSCQRQVQRGGAGADGGGVAGAGELAELPLERLHVRPYRSNPVGRECLGDVPLLQLAHVRRREIHSLLLRSLCHPYPSAIRPVMLTPRVTPTESPLPLKGSIVTPVR